MEATKVRGAAEVPLIQLRPRAFRDACYRIGPPIALYRMRRSLSSARPANALGRRYDLVDLCHTGLPCTVILDQTAEVVEDKAEPAEEPDQRALHHGTNVLDVMIAAHLKGAADQPYRDVAKHPAIFWVSTAQPEFFRDRKPGEFSGARMR